MSTNFNKIPHFVIDQKCQTHHHCFESFSELYTWTFRKSASKVIPISIDNFDIGGAFINGRGSGTYIWCLLDMIRRMGSWNSESLETYPYAGYFRY